MGRLFSKFIALNVFVGLVSSGTVGAVGDIFGRGVRRNDVGRCCVIISSVKSDSKVLREKTEEIEEKVKKLEERACKSEEDLKKHKEKDYHGRVFTKGGSIWKNIANSLANYLVAEVVLLPIKVGGYFIILDKALPRYVNVRNEDPNSI